jgi:hypothetical protein
MGAGSSEGTVKGELQASGAWGRACLPACLHVVLQASLLAVIAALLAMSAGLQALLACLRFSQF